MRFFFVRRRFLMFFLRRFRRNGCTDKFGAAMAFKVYRHFIIEVEDITASSLSRVFQQAYFHFFPFFFFIKMGVGDSCWTTGIETSIGPE